MCQPANSPICQKWAALGGEPVLGIAVGTPELILDGKTTLQRFEKGAIFLTNSYGTFYLSKELFAIWESVKGLDSLPSEPGDLQMFLGCPVSDTFAAPQGSEACYFERGMLVFKDEPPTEIGGPRKCAVYGKNFDKYMATGGLNGPLGLPKAITSFDNEGVLTSTFDNGMICSQVFLGSGVLFYSSPIYSRWRGMIVAAEFPHLGCPTTDEQPVLKDEKEVGRFQRFRLGAIYWSPNTGAFDVRGRILSAWEGTFGGPNGELGFPISNHGKAPESNKVFNNFENGILVFDEEDPNKGVFKAKTLEFYVSWFVGTDSDEIVSTGGLQIYVNSTVAHNGKWVFNGRLPANKNEFYGAEANVNLAFPITSVVNDKTVASFDFQGRESDVGKSDTLGRVFGAYNIDNLWGLTKGLAVESDDLFHVTCGCREAGGVIDPAKPFRSQALWSFPNPTTDDLSKEQYAATFSDIDAGTLINIDPSTWLNEVWEAIFYRLVYKDLAEDGNCFGMCVEAIYAQVGRSFWTEPISKYNGSEGG